MNAFYLHPATLRITLCTVALCLGGILQTSVRSAAQGTGEWDGVMSPQAEEHHQLGRAAMARGDWKEAQRELWRALKYTRKAVPVYNSLGEVNLATGEIDRAIVNFRIAIALGPLHAPAYANMGRALERRKDLAGAREFYEGALRLEATWPEIRLALASVLVSLGDTRQAKEQFQRILKDDPANVDARYQLGLTLLALDDAKGAESELARVVEARPNEGKSRYDWGRALLELGRRAEAAAAFQKARELDHGLPPPPGEQVDTPAK